MWRCIGGGKGRRVQVPPPQPRLPRSSWGLEPSPLLPECSGRCGEGNGNIWTRFNLPHKPATRVTSLASLL